MPITEGEINMKAYNMVDDMFESLYINNDSFFNLMERETLYSIECEIQVGPVYFTIASDEKYTFDGFQAIRVFSIEYMVKVDTEIIFFDVNFGIIYRYDLRV
jgi:hypothetical protein